MHQKLVKISRYERDPKKSRRAYRGCRHHKISRGYHGSEKAIGASVKQMAKSLKHEEVKEKFIPTPKEGDEQHEQQEEA